MPYVCFMHFSCYKIRRKDRAPGNIKFILPVMTFANVDGTMAFL